MTMTMIMITIRMKKIFFYIVNNFINFDVFAVHIPTKPLCVASSSSSLLLLSSSILLYSMTISLLFLLTVLLLSSVTILLLLLKIASTKSSNKFCNIFCPLIRRLFFVSAFLICLMHLVFV